MRFSFVLISLGTPIFMGRGLFGMFYRLTVGQSDPLAALPLLV
jgi:hypothetical protein